MTVRKRWAVVCNGRQMRKTVRAHTKSEARAFFKKIAHVVRGERLPMEYKVVEVAV